MQVLKNKNWELLRTEFLNRKGYFAVDYVYGEIAFCLFAFIGFIIMWNEK